MRLWSIHPCYLDARGLVALWREGLLAQEVLQGNTRGYKNHPQLIRFRNTNNPVGAIASYLRFVLDEAESRGYHFNRDKIVQKYIKRTIPVTTGQARYEFDHLLNKLKTRSRESYDRARLVKNIELHPIFNGVTGDVEDWEIF